MSSTFAEAWSKEIWPTISAIHNDLRQKRPVKQDEAMGVHYGTKVLEWLPAKKEVRNVTCNLAWLPPAENTLLQQNISLDSVTRWALDFYVNMNQIAASAEAENVNTDGAADSAASAAEDIVSLLTKKDAKKPWKVPAVVPKEYGIPIAISHLDELPEIGQFVRLGLDIAVNGTWLAMKWAVDEKNDVVKAQLVDLILNWPMDFFLFQGDAATIQSKILAHTINLPAAVERLLDFCGLAANNLMKLCSAVRDLLQQQSLGKVRPLPPEVLKWMLDPDHIRWGIFRIPSVRTVTANLGSWDAISSNKTALMICDKAHNCFGRGNLFD